MKVRVQPSGSGAARAVVQDTSDLGRLEVELAGVDEATASAALADAGLGEVRGGHAWLDVGALRAAAVGPSGPEGGEFDAMVSYAASRGWVSADGRALRAHVVA